MKLTKKRIIGYTFLGIAFLVLLAKHYSILYSSLNNLISFFSIITIAIGILLIFPFELIPLFIFDNSEWRPNNSIPALIKKIRLRALLFFNLSVVIFLVTLIVIIASYYILINPQVNEKNDPNVLGDIITIRISATALVIFLVQILFRVFKYLLRVAAFYNAKADAMEFHVLNPKMDLTILMDLFTPEKYDISDVVNPSFFNKITGSK